MFQQASDDHAEELYNELKRLLQTNPLTAGVFVDDPEPICQDYERLYAIRRRGRPVFTRELTGITCYDYDVWDKDPQDRGIKSALSKEVVVLVLRTMQQFCHDRKLPAFVTIVVDEQRWSQNQRIARIGMYDLYVKSQY